MNTKRMLSIALVGSTLAAAAGWALSAQDKYSLKVPGGLEFAEFRGYESWQVISISHSGPMMAVTVGNPAIVKAFKSGIPGNGQPFPDGSKMAKVHWAPKSLEAFPNALVPGKQLDVDFMVKDSKRFGDVGGWGYAFFEYDAAADAFRPANSASMPPQGNDAKCGVGCHSIAKARDFVFTEYAPR